MIQEHHQEEKKHEQGREESTSPSFPTSGVRKEIMLTAHCLRIVAIAVTPIWFDEQCGSALRGAFFRALWQRFCTNREVKTCKACPLSLACPVASLVAPARDEDTEVPGYGEDLPRPYAVCAPRKPEGRVLNRYETGETFTFDLTLIGTSTRLFPYILRALQEMEQMGFGRPLSELGGKRGRFHIRAVSAYHPFTGQQQSLWQQGATQPQRLTLGVTSKDIAARAQQIGTEQVTLHFLSPTRLVNDRQIVKRPTFYTLIMRLTDRVEQLSHAYSEGRQEQRSKESSLNDRRIIGGQAGRVSLLHDHTQWIQLTSYSSRQQRLMPLDGFVGQATFAGNIAPLRELLAWGEILHVGKSATKGNGYYRIETSF